MRVAAFIVVSGLIAGCGGTPAAPSRQMEAPPPFRGEPTANGGWANVVVLPSGLPGALSWETLTTDRRIAGATTESASAMPPVNLVGTPAGSTVTLAWTLAGSEAALGYIIEAGSRPGLADLANFDTGNPAVSLTATAVPAGTYYVRVRLRAASGVSAPSNEISLVVGSSCISAPGPPSGLSSSVSGSTVTLLWSAPVSGCAVAGYTVEAGSSAGASNLANLVTGSMATMFSASGVGNGTYYLRVRATNAFGASAPSNESTLTVGSVTTSAFTVDMPIAAGDTQTSAYGIWPFGVHGGGHAADGHPGWDVEYRPGANVLVAADGTISSVFLAEGDRYTIRIQHTVGSASYATDYTNIGSPGPGIATGARVTRGQLLGSAGVQSQFIGTTQVTWAMTHFQVNDFTRSEGLTNPNAVSPESYLSPSGRTLFDSIWRTAAYQTEWCEPFSANSRLATFPVSRTWRLQSGSSQISSIEIRCLSATTNDMAYSLSAAGSVIESGTFVPESSRKPIAFADFRPTSGPSRLGVWDIYNDTLQLNLGAAGAARPSSLPGAAVYMTTR